MKQQKESAPFFQSGLFQRFKGSNPYEYFDMFTGLPNNEKLQQDFASLGSHKDYAFVQISINAKGFNRVSAIFGLDTAGETIRRLCPLMTAFAEENGGKAYRLSLIRFALLAPVKDRAKFESETRVLCAALEQIHIQDAFTEYSFAYTFAYGIYYLTNAPDESLRSIIHMTDNAIEALCRAEKTAGAIFREESRADWERRDVLAKDIVNAWHNREFVPYYQTVHNIKNRKAVGAELLVRWEHHTLGVIPPNEFLPLLEAEGLSAELDLYMLEEACKKIAGWLQDELLTVPLSINISRRNLHRKDFVERVIGTVQNYDVPPELIELELDESIILHEMNPSFTRLMDQLHSFGFYLSMDHFAETDFSSINVLRYLPVDIIKISGRFFENTENAKRTEQFITHVIQMARDMGLKIIVSGVETQEQAQYYQKFGCPLAQGFYFAKPISNEAFEKLIF